MPASATSPADVINLALVRIGYHDRVASLFDGSDQAKNALDIYAQTRDDLMRDGDWQFCQRSINATLLKTAPAAGYFPPTSWDPATYPPLPWAFSYTYPTDCLKVRMMKPQPTFMLNVDPQPTLYAIVNDNGYTPTRRVIVANVADAILVYAGQVTSPSDWPPDFVEALASELGLRLKPVLMGGEMSQVGAADVARSVGTAMQEQG